LIGDFLTPENLDKNVLSKGIIENLHLSFDLDSQEDVKNWKCTSRDFNQFLKKQYPYLVSTLKLQFESFISAEPLPSPASMENNFILTHELLRMLMLVNPKFQIIPKIHLLYSSKVHGQSFNKLINNIVGWPSPALFLLKCSFRGMDGEVKSNVIGAMTFCQLLDKYGFYGNHNTVLFSLTPFFKIIKTKSGKRSNHYLYLNSMASGQK
jgi:hypothetical protein